ncbi:hypothetical protein D0T84_02195 [Dysgonomonas sp. 521]|uniref:hypothetical protein n=1 Tax=Dysgonomonas sp. 521 TaxID=2302932 RepID=UPI0013D7E35C|nr:hypothetical protein [Dysgonomonas sp. 521]NDV93729.1 hypothetical protein [Dysgonomonas sp. 521]
MNTYDIKKLIEAFYLGETTAEEELRLLSYFQGEDVADELLDEKEVFLAMYKSETIDVPAGLESKLNNLIDGLASQETTEAPLENTARRRSLWLKAGSIAAGIAILVSAGVYFNSKADTTPPIAEGQSGTMSKEDEQKIKEAQEALILLSSKFNKGLDQLAVASENMDKTNEILNKTFNRKKDKES